MDRKIAIIATFYIVGLFTIGILPYFLRPTINDGSWETWGELDLAENVTGDSKYFEDTFPKFSQPDNLEYFDLRGKPYHERLALSTLQGLINRADVELFLIHSSTDNFWLQRLEEDHGIANIPLIYPSYLDVVSRYKQHIEGLIVYDHNFIDSVNVATFLAGIYNCTVIHYSMIDDFASIGITEIKFDFRGNFSSKVELYSWAWDNFKDKANNKIVASLDPTRIQFQDYVVASNIFSFSLTPGPMGPTDQIELFKKIISEYPDNTPVFGWFNDPGGALGEYEAVKIISKSGKYSLCAALPDLTVYSSIQGGDHKQKVVDFDSSEYMSGGQVRNKIYVTCIVSDGDNVNHNYDRLQSNWQNADRGSVPIGITLEPAMFEMFPTGLEYYYESATDNEYFLAGPSGAGYCYVDMNPAFPQFLNHSKYAMDQADMQQIWILNGYEGFQLQYSDAILNAYASENCDFSGIYLNYHDYPAELNEMRGEVPVFQSVFVERENEIVGKLQSIYSASTTGNIGEPNAPIFVFIGFWAWDFSFTKLKKAVSKLDSETFVFLRPDHFSELYIESQQAPSMQIQNEFSILVIAGVIPFVVLLGILILIWVNKFKKREDSQDKRDFYEILTNKAVFFVVDFTLLLIIRYCLFSTILNLVSFVLLLLSVSFGIFLKKFLDKAMGVKTNLIVSLVFLSIGCFLFWINAELVIIAGFSIGILLSHQIKLNSSLLGSTSTSRRTFLYSLIIATAIILLFPPEYYSILLAIAFFTSIAAGCSGIALVLSKRKDEEREFILLKGINHWYMDGVVLGFLLYFLFIPSYAPESLYFHLFWGVGFYPTRLMLSFNIASLYILAVVLSETINLRKIKDLNGLSLILCTSSVFLYALMFVLLNGIIIFILLNFLIIFGIILRCIYIIEKQPVVKRTATPDLLIKDKFTTGGFSSQLIFWLMLGLLLTFIPPSIIIVDGQEIFAAIGVPAISKIDWVSFYWYIFYLPSLYSFIAIPISVGVIGYGIYSIF